MAKDKLYSIHDRLGGMYCELNEIISNCEAMGIGEESVSILNECRNKLRRAGEQAKNVAYFIY